MESHFEDVLQIADRAQIAGVSQRRMERLFEAEQACSPVNFYLQLRLERAEQLLTYTGMSARDVGLAFRLYLAGAILKTVPGPLRLFAEPDAKAGVGVALGKEDRAEITA
ncbi:MAG: helix-turn-helix domain-containing protein [Hyphomicrobiales bacterium]|nr:helix-turn-helix domain-containing protein [Hyphomicrobiales bacterium]